MSSALISWSCDDGTLLPSYQVSDTPKWSNIVASHQGSPRLSTLQLAGSPFFAVAGYLILSAQDEIETTIEMSIYK